MLAIKTKTAAAIVETGGKVGKVRKSEKAGSNVKVGRHGKGGKCNRVCSSM